MTELYHTSLSLLKVEIAKNLRFIKLKYLTKNHQDKIVHDM